MGFLATVNMRPPAPRKAECSLPFGLLHFLSLLLPPFTWNLLSSSGSHGIHLTASNSESPHLCPFLWLLTLPKRFPGRTQSGNLFSTRAPSLSGWKDSVQFSSVTQSCLTLCDPMDCSTPGLPVHHQLPELTHTHVH